MSELARPVPVRRLTVDPGDVLVVELAEPVSVQERDAIRLELLQSLDEPAPIMVVNGRLKVLHSIDFDAAVIELLTPVVCGDSMDHGVLGCGELVLPGQPNAVVVNLIVHPMCARRATERANRIGMLAADDEVGE